MIDLDASTVAVLRAHRKARGGMALQFARDDALVFADQEGRYLHPERFTRSFQGDVARCRKATGEETLPVIRLHDLRRHQSGSTDPYGLAMCRLHLRRCRVRGGIAPKSQCMLAGEFAVGDRS